MGKVSHVTLRVTRKEKEQIRAAANLLGLSMNRFVIVASEQKATRVRNPRTSQTAQSNYS